MRELPEAAAMERALVKKYRKQLWQPGIAAVKRYRLLAPGDRVEVPLDGSSQCLLAAKLIQEILRHTDFPFEAVFTAPAELLAETRARGLPAVPPEEARDCPVRAAPDCMSDAVEAVLAGMLYEGELGSFRPREEDPRGVRIIRPLYCTERRDVRAWCRYCGLPFVPRAADADPRRQRVRALLEELRRENPNVEISLFRSLHAVHLDTFRAFGGAEKPSQDVHMPVIPDSWEKGKVSVDRAVPGEETGEARQEMRDMSHD